MVTDLVLYTGYCKEYVAVILCPDLMCQQGDQGLREVRAYPQEADEMEGEKQQQNKAVGLGAYKQTWDPTRECSREKIKVE